MEKASKLKQLKPIPLTQKLVAKSFRQRISWIRRFFLLIILIIALRALQLQLIERPALEKRANRDWNQSVSVKLRRGPIYDREGQVLAVSLPLESVFAIPHEIEAQQKSAQKLGKILKVSQKELQKKLEADVSFTWLKRNTNPAISSKIRALDLKGIHFLKEYQRFYPMRNHAAQLLGFSGIDSQGLEGIEYKFNTHLMDNSGLSTIWNQFYRNPKLKTVSGGAITLTIQSKLQYFVEKELRKAVTQMVAKNGVAIVMKSKTGEILALANVPDYDPNAFDRYDSSRYFNRAVTATYEPGSTFKIITIASALNNDVVQKDSIFFCEEGEYQIQDRVIHDVEKLGWLPLQKIIQKSSNICAAKIGQRIPKPVFYKSIRDFGFGSETGIELPGEVGGKVHSYQNWSDTDVATISFGHTISVTPIQVLTAINSVASGGVLIKPYIIKSAQKGNGDIIQRESSKGRQILKAETAALVKEYMVTVTQKGGTGRLAAIKGLAIGGKTGTSRKFDIRKRKYSKTQHITSFVGFFPAENPLFTILVVIDEPQHKYLYSKGAAPVFRKIAEQTLRFNPDLLPTKIMETGVSKTKEPIFAEGYTGNATGNPTKTARDQFRGKTLREALLLADEKGLIISAKGSGRVTAVSTIDDKLKKVHLEFK